MRKKSMTIAAFILGAILFLALFRSSQKHLFFYPEYKADELFSTVTPWVLNQNSNFGLTKDELFAAKTFVRDSIIGGQIFETDSTKAKYICNFVNDRLKPNQNVSETYSHHINAWQQWKMLDGQNLSTYCVGYATVYHLFSTLAGLQTRMIAVSGNGINHIFCETYIGEKKQWALTDIMFDNVLVNDTKGNFINTNNYKDAQGNCILTNQLCKEYENATNFKYYKNSVFEFGYPFSYTSMMMRILSPQAETVIKGRNHSEIRYFFLMLGIYATTLAFCIFSYKMIKK